MLTIDKPKKHMISGTYHQRFR